MCCLFENFRNPMVLTTVFGQGCMVPVFFFSNKMFWGFGACRKLMYSVYPFCCKLSLVIDVYIGTYLGPCYQMHLCVVTFKSIWLDSVDKYMRIIQVTYDLLINLWYSFNNSKINHLWHSVTVLVVHNLNAEIRNSQSKSLYSHMPFK